MKQSSFRYLSPRPLAAGVLLVLAATGCGPAETAAPPVQPATAQQSPAPPTSAPPVAAAPPTVDAAHLQPAGDPAAGDSAAGAPAAGEPGFAPVTSRGAGVPAPVAAPPLPVSAGAAGGKILAPGASFDLPAGWQSEEPNSSMRLAQASVPGSAGPGLLAVFYFGAGGGGGVDANLDRWIGQMEIAAGVTPERETFTVGNYRVTTVLASGTLKGGTMGGPAEPTPNAALLGAVVEGDQGPWFFKLTGPAKTLKEQRDAFMGMLRSARPKI